ncbi:hypothetical protein WDZ92_27880 [Nostoc sp. NIES-2111]
MLESKRAALSFSDSLCPDAFFIPRKKAPTLILKNKLRTINFMSFFFVFTGALANVLTVKGLLTKPRHIPLSDEVRPFRAGLPGESPQPFP